MNLMSWPCVETRIGQHRRMRSAPTFGYLFVVMGSLVLAATGCATSNGDVDPSGSETPSTETPAQEKKADDKAAPPKFDANIPPEDSKKNEDPAPPGATQDQCIDNGDPGGAENLATKLPDTDDCDNNYKTVTGTMKGAVDVDFYKLSASDLGVSLSHPTGCSLDTDFEAQTAGTELCVFMRCKNSTVDAVTGCDQGTATTSDIGMKGCCAAAPGHAVPKWDCSGFTDDDSADIFMRVRQINGDKCLPYTLKYRF